MALSKPCASIWQHVVNCACCIMSIWWFVLYYMHCPAWQILYNPAFMLQYKWKPLLLLLYYYSDVQNTTTIIIIITTQSHAETIETSVFDCVFQPGLASISFWSWRDRLLLSTITCDQQQDRLWTPILAKLAPICPGHWVPVVTLPVPHSTYYYAQTCTGRGWREEEGVQ